MHSPKLSQVVVAFAVAMATSPAALAEGAPPTVKGAEQFHLTEAPQTTAALEAAIAKADSDLFDAVFIQCDSDKVAGMLTEDFRFLHDKGGLTPTKAQFVANLRKGCAQQAAGTDFRARRELIPGTMQVWPINNYGAVEFGEHNFYARIPGKPDQLTETGQFMILWHHVDGKWLMSESISYGHKLAR
jgi:hypothetical protein